MRSQWSRLVFSLALLATSMLGCAGGGSGGGNTPGGGNPSYSLALNPASLTIAKGSTGTSVLTLMPMGGFTGEISKITQFGFPNGVSAAWQKTDATSYKISITVDATATPVNAQPFTLTANATGAPDASVTGYLTIPGAAVPSFSLSASPAALTIAKGSAAATGVFVTGSNGFSGAVTLTASGLPSGVTSAFTTNPTAGSSTLTLTVGTSAAAGTSTVTITGQASGAADAATTLTLTVTTPTQPSFSLGASPSALSIPKGSAAATGISITGSNGFSGAVTLTASNLPTGVTAAFTPNPTSASSSLTLTVGPAAAAGTSSITITGQASGAPNATTTVSLTVTQPAGGNVSMIPCLQDNDVIFFAFQDGNGPWTAVSPSGGTYTFSIASGRGAAAITLRNQQYPEQIYTMVVMGSTADLNAWMPNPCPGYQPVSGTYSGVTAGHTVSISVGIAGINNSMAAGGSGPWTSRTVMKKPLGDLFAAESLPGGTTVKCILRRDLPLSVPNPGVGGDLNFSAAEAFVPGSANITLTGLGGSNFMVNAITHLWNPQLDVGVVGTAFAFGGAALPAISLVPASRLRSGDLQSIMATAIPGDYQTNGTSPMLLSQEWIATPHDVTLDFKAPSTPPTVTSLQNMPHPRQRVLSSMASPYTSSFLYNAVQVQGTGAAAPSRGWQIIVSSGWLAAGGSFPLDTPELSGAAGWNGNWDLWPSTKILWHTTHSGATWTNGIQVDGGRQWTCNYAAEMTP